MTAISDTYSNEPVAEAGQLSERELAVLLVPRDQMLEGEDAAIHSVAVERVQKMLALAVSKREGRACSRPNCHTRAVWLITPEDGDPLQACAGDLPFLIHAGGTVELINPDEAPPDPEPEPTPEPQPEGT
jgi:hypothetical protein